MTNKTRSNPSEEPRIPTAAVVATGSELVLGRTVDTNSAMISRRLSSMGVSVLRHLTVPDDCGLLEKAIREAGDGHDITILTGGLGPTEDDFTRIAAAWAYGVPLRYEPGLHREVRERMAAFYARFPINNHRQAWLPEGFLAIANPFGSAPAFARVSPGKLFVFLPWVPREAEGLLEGPVSELIRRSFPNLSGTVKTRVLIAALLVESRVDELLGDLLRDSENPRIGLTAALSETKVRLNATAGSEEEAELLNEAAAKEIIRRLGPHYAGEGDEGVFRKLAEMTGLSPRPIFLSDSATLGILSQKLLSQEPKSGSFLGSLILPEGAPLGEEKAIEASEGALLCHVATRLEGEDGPAFTPFGDDRARGRGEEARADGRKNSGTKGPFLIPPPEEIDLLGSAKGLPDPPGRTPGPGGDSGKGGAGGKGCGKEGKEGKAGKEEKKTGLGRKGEQKKGAGR